MTTSKHLIDEIARLTWEMHEAEDHIGRYNRIAKKLERLYSEIDASSHRAETYLSLFSHPDLAVRSSSAWHCGWRNFMAAEAEQVIRELSKSQEYYGELDSWRRLRPEMEKQRPVVAEEKVSLRFPAPREPLTRERALAFIERRFLGSRAEEIAALLRRSIEITHGPYNGDPLASRFGGLPMMPPRERWLKVDGEPLLFLGQINCLELHSAVGETPLPRDGMLLFFGDHDEVNGCGPNLGGAVVYVPNLIDLRSMQPPVEDFEPHVQCGLSFHETYELPDPKSSVIENLGFTAAEAAAYSELIGEIEQRHEFDTDRSKLLGWPNLIQRDLAKDDFTDVQTDDLLLAQIGCYHDGNECHGWGPGGLVYFTINRESLTNSKFGESQMSVQCT